MGAHNTPPHELLTRRLRNYTRLSAEETRAIGTAFDLPVRSIAARRDLVAEGDDPRGLRLIVSGWSYRYKMLADARRQFVAFLVPGDLCDLNNTLLDRMDHSIGALTPVRFVEIPNETVNALMLKWPRVGRALWWQMLVMIAIQREWTLSMGRRSALERVAHHFCELYLRMKAVGLAEAASFEFPLTQTEIADATGLTSVHVNRILQQLRSMKIISLSGRRLTILDLDALRKVASFASDYLHLDGSGDGSGLGVVAPGGGT